MTFSHDPAVLTSAWQIELRSDHAVARFAAQELRRTLQRIGAPALPIVEHASGRRIALAHGTTGDTFVRTPDQYGLSLRGAGPRGLLYAVYDLLEALGCRWVAPGPSGERLPQLERVILPELALAQGPAFAARCLVLGSDYFLADAEDWIVWAARNRLNTLFVHTTPRLPAIGACRPASWRKRRSALLPLLRERGFELELGGHGLRELVPRRLFRNEPALFRFDGARRTADYNFCPSNPRSLALVRAGAAAFFRTYPEATVYHLWPDDMLGGGWCCCPQCAGLSPADQAMIAANAMAEALAALNPTATVAHLAYHDTETPPTNVMPRANLSLLYAPRPRSYARGIGDPASLLNQPFAGRLAAQITLFNRPENRPDPLEGQPDPAARRLAVFEYYLDGILFKGIAPALGTTMQADLQYYLAAGIQNVQALMTGFRPWIAGPPNAYLFARLAWDPDQDAAELLAAYAAARAPRSPAALTELWLAHEQAWNAALDVTPAELKPAAERRRDLIAAPPTDVLDYMAAPRPASERRLERLHNAERRLSSAVAGWEQVMATAYADRPHLAAEQAEWEVGRRLLRFLALRQQLYVLEQRGAGRAALQEGLRDARAALSSLQNDQPGQPGMELLILFLGLQLDRLFDRKLATPWQRLALRIRRYLALARLIMR